MEDTLTTDATAIPFVALRIEKSGENMKERAMNFAWSVVKIIWAIYCSLYLSDSCVAFVYDPDFLILCLVFVFWFFSGFLFCLLQNKYQELKWVIVTHIFITTLFFTPSSLFYSSLLLFI
jgi:hypothetical protein